MKKVLLVIVISLCGLVSNAQTKMGYVNSKQILTAIPEIKKIDSSLNSYKNSINNQLEKMGNDFKSKADGFIKDSASYLPSIKELKRKELSEDVEKIQKFKEQAEKDLKDLQEKMYFPVLDRINKSIQKIAKEGKYDYIIDVSVNSFVYVNNKLDLTDLVIKNIK